MISDEILTNQGAYVIANDLKLSYLSDLDLEGKKYEMAIKNQSRKLVQRKVNEEKEVVRPFWQKNVYSQEHENLCGYHTLINIILRSKKEDITSKERYTLLMTKVLKILQHTVETGRQQQLRGA